MKAIIETKRIILRKFIEEDYKAVFEFSSNLEVQKYTGDEVLKSPNQAKKIITDIWFTDYKKYGYGRWAVVYKPENKVIGFAGLKYLPEFNETDIGFRFLPEYWGKGIATEASKEIIKYGFEVLKLEKIIGIAFPKNIASCKVLEKIGLNHYKVDSYDGDGGEYNWYQLKRENYLS
jgi:RimJ/RimL family protein N-acetyltransferase